MDTTSEPALLDIARLREVTMDDEDLMCEIMAALLEDTTHQMVLLSEAIESQDPQLSMRLAHYSKGACANVGATRAADILKSIERGAASGQFHECRQALDALSREMELLRCEAASL